jgi:hypothetical protein
MGPGKFGIGTAGARLAQRARAGGRKCQPKIRAYPVTPNNRYNLMGVIYHVLQGGQRYGKYAEDAEREGNREAARFPRLATRFTGNVVRVKSPIDLGIFAEGRATRAAVAGSDRLGEMAA